MKKIKLWGSQMSNNVIKYDRLKGVPQDHYKIMKIDCFGEMGGPYYSDSIIYHSESKDKLVELCEKEKYNTTGAWHDYFISDPES
jgi:hypothetical protein